MADSYWQILASGFYWLILAGYLASGFLPAVLAVVLDVIFLTTDLKLVILPFDFLIVLP